MTRPAGALVRSVDVSRGRRMRYDDDPLWASLSEAARTLHVSTKTVARMIDRGALKGGRISGMNGSHRRVSRAALRAELDSRDEGAPPAE